MGTDFPDRLKAARTLRKMNQTDLAARAGLPSTSISHFEAGSRKPSFDNLRRLAVALQVTTDYLLGLVDDPAFSTTADPIYRDSQKLTDDDRDLTRRFLEMLTRRNQDAEKKD